MRICFGASVFVLLAVLALAGCSDSELESSVENAVEELLGTQVSEEEAQAASQARSEREEELIATCMRSAGHEYVPRPVVAPEVLDSNDQDGYGIATSYLAFVEGTAVLQRIDSDPNVEILSKLGPQEQAAWRLALSGGLGNQILTPEEATEALFEGTANGCAHAARLQIAEETGPTNQQLIDAYKEHMAGVRFDARVQEAQDGWPVCMSQAGYSFSSTVEPSQLIADEMSRFARSIVLVPMDETGRPQLSRQQLSDLSRLAEEERELAKLDRTCSEPIRTAMREVATELQQEFLEKYG